MRKLFTIAAFLFLANSVRATTPNAAGLFPGHEKDCANYINVGGDAKDQNRIPQPGWVPFRLTQPVCVATDSLSGRVWKGFLPTGHVLYAQVDGQGNPIPSSFWVDACGNNVLRIFSRVIHLEPALETEVITESQSRDRNWRDSRDRDDYEDSYRERRDDDRYLTREELLQILLLQQQGQQRSSDVNTNLGVYLGMYPQYPQYQSYGPSFNFDFGYGYSFQPHYPRYRDYGYGYGHHGRGGRHYVRPPRQSPPPGCGGNCTGQPYPRKPPLPGNGGGCTNCTGNPYPRHPRH